MFLCTKLLRKIYKGQRYYHIGNNLNEIGAIKFQKRFKSQIKAKLCINAESATHKMFLLCGKFTQNPFLFKLFELTPYLIYDATQIFSAGGQDIDIGALKVLLGIKYN